VSKRNFLAAALVGGLALLLAACGGGGSQAAVETPAAGQAAAPAPPDCLPPGAQVADHLRRWAGMCDTWEPLRVDPQMQGAFGRGGLTGEDAARMAAVLRDFEVAKRLALVTYDPSWLERMGVATDHYLQVVREDIWPGIERGTAQREQEEGRRSGDFEVGRYRPVIITVIRSAAGIAVGVQECMEVEGIWIDLATGEELKRETKSRLVDVRLVRTGDGRFLVDAYRSTRGECPYDGAMPVPQ